MSGAADKDWVKLQSAGSNMEASIIRAYLQDHGIGVFVQGENHRSMMGMLGAFIELNILVPASELDRAIALMDEFEVEDEADPAETRGPFRDDFESDEDDEAEATWRSSRERALAIKRARLAALIVPLGGGHFAAGAPLTGLVLAAIAVGGVIGAVDSHAAWAALVPFAIFNDWLGIPGAVDRKALAAGRRLRAREDDAAAAAAERDVDSSRES